MSILLIKNRLKKLPPSSGVYIFKDKHGEIVYVGKATTLKSRVSSYFLNKANQEFLRPIERMIRLVTDIKVIETETVMEALILEANLIRKYQPKWNVDGKDDKSFSYFAITKEDFPRIFIKHESDLVMEEKRDLKNKNLKYAYFYGPYTSKFQMQIVLKIVRRIFPYHSRNEKSEKGCLEFQIGLCPGPYDDAISKEDYKNNIQGIRMILRGKKKRLVKMLEREMEKYSKEENFEKALELRNKIFALRHIQEIALLKRDEENGLKNTIRIEAYDISNISGSFAVGSMIVFKGNDPDKSQYRKFKIKTVAGSDDLAMMKEVLLRRFRNDWPLPDLIILDGGKGHYNMGIKILGENSIDIPLAGIAKGPTRKKLEVIGKGNIKDKKIKDILKDERLLKKITDEAHRFAITYHKKIRDNLPK
ncbi:MAG TPA: hypothetical protein DDY52_02830 [Candidatus Moranbacteria bacterium]|nr:MAG: Excinuclease ABC C subunit domain protein [Candidatus Moranbacteria bacterium GW2011_GWF1_34_10]HBI17058.1 hypothetical protein [Candidatus Moranbacteria bacterium]